MGEYIAEKPKIILDIASGMGGGAERYIQKIDWPCMLVFTDLSYRILSWDKRYFETVKANLFVDMVFIACDCAKLPIKTESFDMVLSHGGFESMREKRMNGVTEALLILKPGAAAVYDMSIVEDKNIDNSKKWLDLTRSLRLHSEQELEEQYIDLNKWNETIKSVGFSDNKSIEIYGELPAPDTDVFPYENEIMQWMCEYIMVSQK